MDLGFHTIGNATLVAFDRDPVIATDPWIEGSAYFGSWRLSHAIPEEQARAIRACPFVWFSHGHPDHLNPESLPLFKGKTILLPDHVGGRIKDRLEADGYLVRVLPDRTWVTLSERIRVLSIADYYQDGILLLDVGGTLVLDLNDASDRGWGRFVRKTAAAFGTSVLLALAGGGDTDMIHFQDESGRLLLPESPGPVGAKLARLARKFGVTHCIPFSSMHAYQRRDSVWASAYTARLEDHARGFDAKALLLPAFVRFDATTGLATEIGPEPLPATVIEPASLGDDWSDVLEPGERATVERYFRSIEHLSRALSFVNVRVGGKDLTISLGKSGPGVTFEVPRGSLLQAIEHEIWDDLLIGNFMKTTLHGTWPRTKLYPDVAPYVAKFADNGRARTEAEVEAYLAEYRRRAPIDFIRHRLEERAVHGLRGSLRPGSRTYQVARRAYRFFKGS